MKYKAVIFDMDGTLLDSLGDLRDAVNHVLRSHGYPVRTTEEIRAFVGNGARVLMERALPEYIKTDAFETLLAEYRSYYQAHNCVTTRPYDGVPELLAALADAGVQTAVVTNKPHPTACALAERFFPGVAAFGDGLPGLNRKPAPDMVWHALSELEVPQNAAVYVGDSEVDVETARRAGLDLIAVSWGFRTAAQLRQAGAERIADTARELLELVN